MSFALAMALALAIDAVVGWPAWLYARIGHPVTWVGALIRRLDRALNRDDDSDFTRRWAGIGVVMLLIGLVAGITIALQALLPGSWIMVAVLSWPLIAARSMADHVRAVADPLIAGNLDDARQAVAMIVGRNPSKLDETGVARAAIESLAENTSDGITAPLFWGALFGLPGIAVYKVINTLDSMIGYRTPRHEAFGWAAARLDDVVNWVPARITGVIFAALSMRFLLCWQVIRRDAKYHRSPNAGWPEAAMAGALDVRLSGPRVYATGPTDDPFVNADGRDPEAADLARGLQLYSKTLWAMGAALVVVGLLFG